MIKWLRKSYNIVVNSIAFFPAIIAIGFLLLSWAMLELDFSAMGKQIKGNYSWVRLKDASTARSIVSTIASGIISLTVFSFSMVMILLNQAASQMSNRMLESMIGNRFQQIILGFYIGTIVYALFLLSTIRDIYSGVYIPALSIYLLLLLTVLDIFLFIYFLHYVTQLVKFEIIIGHVGKKTFKSLKKACFVEQPFPFEPQGNPQHINVPDSNFFQEFNKMAMLELAVEFEGMIRFLKPAGSFLLKGIPLLAFFGTKKLTEEDKKRIIDTVDFYKGQPIEKNHYFGFHQLAEVAIKALSPGINDPETAVLAVNALTGLFLIRMENIIKTVFEDNDGHARIKTCEWDFEPLFLECFQPIWEYGKKDLYIQNELRSTMEQLKYSDKDGHYTVLYDKFLGLINAQVADNVFTTIK
ncbi:DUF2254 domain-containing protein [Ferruginibacter sp.]|uniref:DUF2254 domain-containing protein n=1 Tax=Ferruginibacter sp. TaxID=1940288 RepID=UPI001984F8F1|nr:DUF2254 domain-containing protein [Ferruginibacter sp.]MBC7625827.1 DUF2254 domain-containing protein [Ferruginibacter sp.]